MIEVKIFHDKNEIGRITIENLVGDTEYSDYSVRFAVDKIAGVGVHQRGIWGFPRKQYNVLALLRVALETLEPEELYINGNLDEPPSKGRASWKGRLLE